MWQGGEREEPNPEGSQALGVRLPWALPSGWPPGPGSLDYANIMLPWSMKLLGGKLISEAIGHQSEAMGCLQIHLSPHLNQIG